MPSPRGSARRRPIAEARGLTDICDVAVRLFAERGYGETGMKDIAAALGVQAPSLYNYVTSKRELLDMVCVEAARGMSEALEMGLSLSADVTEQVRRGMEEQVRYRVRHPYHLQTISRETLNLAPAVRKEIFAARDHQRGLWRGVVDRGVDEGRFVTPSAELSSHLLAEMCTWVQVKHFALEESVPETQLVYWFGDVAVGMLTRAADTQGRAGALEMAGSAGAGEDAG